MSSAFGDTCIIFGFHAYSRGILLRISFLTLSIKYAAITRCIPWYFLPLQFTKQKLYVGPDIVIYLFIFNGNIYQRSSGNRYMKFRWRKHCHAWLINNPLPREKQSTSHFQVHQFSK